MVNLLAHDEDGRISKAEIVSCWAPRAREKTSWTIIHSKKAERRLLSSNLDAKECRPMVDAHKSPHEITG